MIDVSINLEDLRRVLVEYNDKFMSQWAEQLIINNLLTYIAQISCGYDHLCITL